MYYTEEKIRRYTEILHKYTFLVCVHCASLTEIPVYQLYKAMQLT